MNSMSDSEPRPSLRWNSGSSPGREPLLLDAHLHAPHLAHVVVGRRAAPTRPSSMRVDEPSPRLGVAGHARAPAGRPGAPRSTPTGRGRPPSPRGCAPADRCGPRGGGRRRRPRSRSAGVSPPTNRSRPAATRSASAASPAAPVVDERDVEVAGVAELGAAEPPEGDDARTAPAGRASVERRLEGRLGERARGRRRPDVDGGVAEHVARRDAEQVALLPPLQRPLPVVGGRSRQAMALSALATRSSRGRVRSRLGCGRRSMRSGLATRTSPSCRLVPSRSARWRATSGESRKAVASARERCSPDARRRRPSSPRSGSGEADSQSSSSGSSCCIIRDERVRPAGELGDGLAGALDVGEPERGEPLGGGHLAERAGAGRATPSSGRNHTRSWTRAHAARGGAARSRSNGLGGPAPRGCPGSRARGPARRRSVAVGGHGVRLALVLELQRVLDAAEEPVRVGEHRRRRRGRRSRRGASAVERGERAAGAQLGVDPTVHELEELRGELDVADAARAALHVAVGAAAPADLLLGPHLEGAHVAEVVGARTARPTRTVGRGAAHARAELGVARRPARALRRAWRSHGSRPALPVGLVGGEAAHERAVAALGPQVGVDAEAAAGELEQARARPARGARGSPSPTSRTSTSLA